MFAPTPAQQKIESVINARLVDIIILLSIATAMPARKLSDKHWSFTWRGWDLDP